MNRTKMREINRPRKKDGERNGSEDDDENTIYIFHRVVMGDL